jgi:hypothetical protein
MHRGKLPAPRYLGHYPDEYAEKTGWLLNSSFQRIRRSVISGLGLAIGN